MAIPNINQITSTLRMMGDGALRQYAAMHKNNPFILPMAIAESNARKQVRAQAQARGAAQPQQKVADASIAEMAAPAVDAMGNVTGYAAGGLPEHKGIARLRTPNIERMAGGGIVAFADGGDVDRYAPGGVTKAGPEFIRFLQNMGIDYTDFAAAPAADKAALTDMFEQTKTSSSATTTSTASTAPNASKAYSAGKAAQPYLQKAGSAVKTGAVPVLGAGLSAAQGLSEIDPAEKFLNDPNVPAFEKAKQFTRTAARTALPYAGGIVGSGIAPIAGTIGGAAVGTGLASIIDSEGEALKRYRAVNEPSKGPTAEQNRAALNQSEAAARSNPSVYGQSASNATANATADAAEKTNAAKPSSVLSGNALTGGRAGAGTAGGTASVASNNPFSMESIQEAQKKAFGNTDYEIGALRNQLAEFRSRTEQRAQEALDRRAKEVTEEGDVYKDRSDRLVERGKKIESQKDQNTGLALLNAGLAIMSTPGSLATAIGKGAQVGTAQYAAGLKDLRAAQERLDEANDRIEDLRMNRKDLNKRDVRALEKERDNAITEGEKLTFAFAKDIYGLNRKQADDVFSQYLQGQKTVYEQGEQTKRTMATINASNDSRTKQIWAGLMQKHGNDPVAAAVEYNALEQGDKPLQTAEKLVQDRVGEWEKANKMQLNLMATQAERDAALKSATQRIRNDIYTQMKLKSTIGAGGSSTAGFKFLGAESP
jgi:hypothetical protein